MQKLQEKLTWALYFNVGKGEKPHCFITSERTGLLTCRKDGLKMKASSCFWKDKQVPISCALEVLHAIRIQNEGQGIIASTWNKPNKPTQTSSRAAFPLHHTKSLPTESQDWEHMVMLKSKKMLKAIQTFIFHVSLKVKKWTFSYTTHFKSTSIILFVLQVLTLRT